jgi:flagellar basal-body rod protein FlgF
MSRHNCSSGANCGRSGNSRRSNATRLLPVVQLVEGATNAAFGAAPDLSSTQVPQTNLSFPHSGAAKIDESAAKTKSRLIESISWIGPVFRNPADPENGIEAQAICACRWRESSAFEGAACVVSLGISTGKACGTPVAQQRSVNISLYQAASALNANSRWQEVIAENMASSSVPGYKRQDVSFQAFAAGLVPTAGETTAASGSVWAMPAGMTHTSFAPGEMRFTGQQTDVGIQGAGFFEVQMPNGGLGYTRDGEFNVNGSGQLTTKQGYLVMGDGGPIQVDRASVDPITVSADGIVSQGNVVRGTLKVVDFNNPKLLSPISGGMFVARDPNLQIASNSAPNLQQFYLEQANTSAVGEMANMITVMRASEANQRIIQMEDERMGRAISELGNPNG